MWPLIKKLNLILEPLSKAAFSFSKPKGSGIDIKTQGGSLRESGPLLSQWMVVQIKTGGIFQLGKTCLSEVADAAHKITAIIPLIVEPSVV